MTSKPPAPPTPRLRSTALRHSVFGRLVVVMLGLALALLLVVGGFFLLIVGPNVHDSVDRVVAEYMRDVAAQGPNLAAAQALRDRLNIDVRFEQGAETWATSSHVPTAEDVRQGRASKWRRTVGMASARRMCWAKSMSGQTSRPCQ